MGWLVVLVVFGSTGLGLACWIVFREPQWALPKWMREDKHRK